MPALNLVRSISAPFSADPDWGADPAATPTEGFRLPARTVEAYLKVRGYNSSGAEISVEDMTLDLALVARFSGVNARGKTEAMFAELEASGAPYAARGFIVEDDLPKDAITLYPRLRDTPTDAPIALDRIDIWIGAFRDE